MDTAETKSRSVYAKWGNKRRSERADIAGLASADFLSPAELSVTDISRGGVGLSGVDRIAVHDTGVVKLHLPGSVEPTTAIATVSWFDGKGHVGLKLIELRSVAPEWQSWFGGFGIPPEGTSPPQQVSEPAAAADDASVVVVHSPDTAAPARAEASEETSYVSPPESAESEVREELAIDVQEPPPRLRPMLRLALRLGSLLVIIACGAVGVRYALWSISDTRTMLDRVLGQRAERPAAGESAEPAPDTAAQPATKAPVPRVQVVVGTPALQTPGALGESTNIRRGKVIRNPMPLFPAAVPPGTYAVNVIMSVSKSGVIDDVAVVGGNTVLAREVVTTLGHWRFSPFYVGSTPVRVKLPVTVTFQKAAPSTAKTSR